MSSLLDVSPPDSWPSPVALPPFDDANATLVERVAPAGWTNPTPRDRYHLVVVGGGTAGLVSAAIAAGLGARVALVERHMFGGDCLNFGCVPSKAVISAARGWHAAATAARDFHAPRSEGSGDFGAVMYRLRALRAQLSEADSVERFRSLGVDVFLGEGRFASRNALTVGGATLRFRRAIIATGARAARPPIPGLADTPYDTNESIFSLTELPPRLVVIGGGPIGVELAQAFARFGSRVTIAHADARLLPREDPDAAALVERRVSAEGVTVLNGARIERVGHGGGEFAVTVSVGGTARVIPADRLLVATGRTPNVDGLGLEAAGVATTKAGVTVDDRYRTSNPAIFAIGDVASALQFTHVADAQARRAVANALFFGLGGGRNRDLVVPRVTYTAPEVAHVGLTPNDAQQRGAAIETVHVDLAHNDRSVLEGDTEGFLKVYLAAGSDRIVGATLVAAHAGEMIGEMTLAITHRLGLGKVGGAIHPYPTRSEVFRKAADTWRRGKLTPLAKGLFARWFALFR